MLLLSVSTRVIPAELFASTLLRSEAKEGDCGSSPCLVKNLSTAESISRLDRKMFSVLSTFLSGLNTALTGCSTLKAEGWSTVSWSFSRRSVLLTRPAKRIARCYISKHFKQIQSLKNFRFKGPLFYVNQLKYFMPTTIYKCQILFAEYLPLIVETLIPSLSSTAPSCCLSKTRDTDKP